MRLDKFLCSTTELSRTLAKKAIAKGLVGIDGKPVKDNKFQVDDSCEIRYMGKQLSLIPPRYIMLNKPTNYICSTVDEVHPSALNLISLEMSQELHIAGRLDVDTTGLVLITDDGLWSHKITSPRKACGKRYRVTLADPVETTAIDAFAEGIQLKNEKKLCQPAMLEILSECEVLLTISEGKYHQVKRMFAALGNRVVRLHREKIGEITLDTGLKTGEWRHLTAAEIASIH